MFIEISMYRAFSLFNLILSPFSNSPTIKHHLHYSAKDVALHDGGVFASPSPLNSDWSKLSGVVFNPRRRWLAPRGEQDNLVLSLCWRFCFHFVCSDLYGCCWVSKTIAASLFLLCYK
jgi:hypothetical protein